MRVTQEPGALNSTLDATRNAPVFELVLKAQENWKSGSQGFQKTTQFDFEIHKNAFGDKFIFAILSFPAVILTLLMATVFAGEYYLADTFAFFLPLAFASAFIGVFLFILQLKSINNRIMKIKQNEH